MAATTTNPLPYGVARALAENTPHRTWTRYAIAKVLHKIRIVAPERHHGAQRLFAAHQNAMTDDALLFMLKQLADLLAALEERHRKFERLLDLEQAVRAGKAAQYFAPTGERARVEIGLTADQRKLYDALNALTPDERRAYGEYRAAALRD